MSTIFDVKTEKKRGGGGQDAEFTTGKVVISLRERR